jgi:high affinity sulfate transporter 1
MLRGTAKLLPILTQLRGYKPAWLKSDLAAGLSVAAVSLPSAIAYPAIAGLPTEIGFYATIFSLVGYGLLGSSRQLMVGPDTATCIMLAGVLATLGASDPGERVALTVALSMLVGLVCVLAGLLRLGFLANFLSRPMLVGFLAGISISLIIGQIKRLTGIPIETEGLLRPILSLASQLGAVHGPTLMVGLVALVLLRVLRKVRPGVPAPLVVIVLGIIASVALDLESHGVAVVGALPEIAFSLKAPDLDRFADPSLYGGALAIAVVGFGSGIVTARSFARKSHSDLNADKELFGFGAANFGSGLFGGFPVSASDSRTAVNFAIGGKTQLTSLIAAATVALSVLFIAHLLAYLPTAILGSVLVSAAIDLIDLKEMRILYRISRTEFTFAILTMLGVVIVGVLQGVFIAIAATLGNMIWMTSHPRLALLGRIHGRAGLYKLHRYPEASAIPGMTIVVLEAPLVFFNAEFVKQKLLKIADAQRLGTAWFVLDAAAVNSLDSTGIETLEELRAHLAARDVAFGIADLNSGARRVLDRAGFSARIGPDLIFASTEAAAAAYETLHPASPVRPS